MNHDLAKKVCVLGTMVLGLFLAGVARADQEPRVLYDDVDNSYWPSSTGSASVSASVSKAPQCKSTGDGESESDDSSAATKSDDNDDDSACLLKDDEGDQGDGSAPSVE